MIGSPHPTHDFTDNKPLLHRFTRKRNLSPRFYRAQMQLTKFSKLKTIQSPGKNLSDADMLGRSFTKAEFQTNQLKHKQLPPQIDFAVLQDSTLKPVQYLIKHEEVLPHQKNDSQAFLADNGPFYSMIPVLQVMMKNISTLEFQNKTHLLLQIKLYMKKLIPLYSNQRPQLRKKSHLQKTYILDTFSTSHLLFTNYSIL